MRTAGPPCCASHDRREESDDLRLIDHGESSGRRTLGCSLRSGLHEVQRSRRRHRALPPQARTVRGALAGRPRQTRGRRWQAHRRDVGRLSRRWRLPAENLEARLVSRTRRAIPDFARRRRGDRKRRRALSLHTPHGQRLRALLRAVVGHGDVRLTPTHALDGGAVPLLLLGALAIAEVDAHRCQASATVRVAKDDSTLVVSSARASWSNRRRTAGARRRPWPGLAPGQDQRDDQSEREPHEATSSNRFCGSTLETRAPAPGAPGAP